MNSFYLNIEHSIRIEIDFALLPDQRHHLLFIAAFHRRPTLAKFGIFDISSQFGELNQIGDPALPNSFCDQFCKFGITGPEPATLGDTVSFIVQPGWPEFMEIAKQTALEQGRMEFSDAIHRIATDYGEVCHAYHRFGTLFDNCHTLSTFQIIRPATGNFGNESGIDFADDFQNPWQE